MIYSGIPGSSPGQALPLQSGLRRDDSLFRSSLTPESSGRRWPRPDRTAARRCRPI